MVPYMYACMYVCMYVHVCMYVVMYNIFKLINVMHYGITGCIYYLKDRSYVKAVSCVMKIKELKDERKKK